MNWLLLLIPVAIGQELLAPERHLLVFITSALAILPLAGWMGRATEQLAERIGEGVGGLLDATFGRIACSVPAVPIVHAALCGFPSARGRSGSRIIASCRFGFCLRHSGNCLDERDHGGLLL
jgi:hypothetical protein